MRFRSLTVAIFTLLATVAAAPSETPNPAASGWTFTHAPLFRPGSDPSPIAVLTVTGDATVGGITQVELRQQHGPQPRSIRLGWYLRVADTVDQVLKDTPVIQHGQTADVVVKDLKPDTLYPVNIIVVDWQEVRRFLPADHKSGVVFIGVAVDQIDFMDGSKWVRKHRAG